MEVGQNIPDIEVKEVMESRDGSYIVTAIGTKEGTECHQCGKSIEKPYGHGEWIMLRHLRIPAKMTAHSGERDRCAHRIGAGEVFLIEPVTISQVGSAICMSILAPVALRVGSDGVLPSLLKIYCYCAAGILGVRRG